MNKIHKLKLFTELLSCGAVQMILAFEFVDKILKCNHSNESDWEFFHVVLSIMLYNVVLTDESVAEILKCDHS